MKHMYRNILFSLFFLAFGSALSAQQHKVWSWINQLGGSSWDMVNGIASDDKSNLYVAGNFSGTLTCNQLKVKAAGGQDIFIACFNEKGNIKELVNTGSTGFDQLNCVISTNDNYLVLAGMISGSFDSGKEPDSAAGQKLFIAKTTVKGKYQWITYLIPDAEASLFLLDADDENIYAAGVYSGTLKYQDSVITSKGKKDIFVLKLNNNGEIEKIISVGSPEDDIPSSMTVTPSGNLYLSGTFKKSFEWDDLFLSTSNGLSHNFILALDSELKARWKKEMHGDEYLNIASLASDAENNVVAAGSYNLNMYAESDVLTSQGYTDCFIIKYSAAGDKIWNKSFGTWYYDHTNRIITDNLGGIILTGSVGDTLEVDSLSIPAQSQNSAVALQFSPVGSIVWGDCISGEGSNFGKEVMLDKNGNLYFAGGFNKVFEKEEEKMVSKGNQDIFFARYFNCDWSNADIIGDKNICPGSQVELSVGSGYSNILWNDSVPGRFYTAFKAGLYTVYMFDKRGCLLTDTLNLMAAASSNFSLGKDQIIPLEASVVLNAPGNYTYFEWQDFSDKSTFVAKAENGVAGKYDYWLSARDSFGCMARDTVSITFYPKANWIDPENIVLRCYPNPVQDWMSWSMNTSSPCKLILDITSDDGRPVKREYIPYYEPGTEMKINLSDYPSGIYYLQVQNASNQSSKAVCIIKQ